MKKKLALLVSFGAVLMMTSCTLQPLIDSASTSGSNTSVTSGDSNTSSDSTISEDSTTSSDSTISEGSSTSVKESVSESVSPSTSSTPVSSEPSTSVEELTKQSSKYKFRDLGDSGDTYFLNSTGAQNILVIPVVVKESNPKYPATQQNKEKIEKVFFGESSDTSWESVASFYKKSSYGKLNLTGTVSDWYTSNMTPTQIYNASNSDYGDGGTYTVLNNAVAWYKSTYNTQATEFDNDKDGFIDGVWLIYSCPNGTSCGSTDDDNPFWAFTFWNYTNYGKDSLASPMAYTYAWASYDFMLEGYGSNGIDAHTYIHETGHMLGANDYYDYDGKSAPTALLDMMDGNILDHNAYTKLAYNWVNPYVATALSKVTLKPFQDSGDCLIVANNWNGSAFDEYLMIELYTPTGLNFSDSNNAYVGREKGFTDAGIKIYHVDARMFTQIYSNGTWKKGSYTDEVVTNNTTSTSIAASNTASSSINSSFKELTLINRSKSNLHLSNPNAFATNSYLFKTGDTFKLIDYSTFFVSSKLNCGEAFNLKLSFDSVTSTGATISITA